MPGRVSPRLAAVRGHAPEAGVLLDFDGTVAAIVVDPALARPLPGTIPVLRALVARFRLVAVVSGRPAAFLAQHLPVPGLLRVGSYGLERVVDGAVELSPEVGPWLPVVAEVVDVARRDAPRGALVEDKGVSVTLHFRGHPETEAWARSFAGEQAAARGLVAHDARRSVELRPPVPMDKGAAVSSLVTDAGLSAACVGGDDAGDLPAFDAVGGLPLGVRVAVRSEEAPPALLAAADLVVDGPEGMLGVLRYLAG
ncbi:MAG TPA: trehalose-phosphatase [Acidimicrobiales bacterium]|nr:trehalose-phosphatase [Acidimicrobiales bacterium]